ncbi:MAG: hypothetical protein IJ863_04370 [Spirochaetales bacterium]|nr:hypothetical protein [Spirochaetales bacterium]
MHTCRCCSFFSPDSHYGCRESIDEPVWDKEKQNFCDHFRLTDRRLGPSKDDERAQRSRAALADLFSF